MCDTIGKIIPGRGALFAKNSDRSPNEPQVLEWYRAASHDESKVMATYIEVDQVKETKAFLLSRPTWLWGGEMGVNECGVCIGNEAVFTKGAYGKTGLTGMDMLRLALERSESAELAVKCIIELLERYGQGGNCGYDHSFFYDNSFLIMDRSSLFVLETAGREWTYKKTDCAAISNRLSIGTEGDVYSGKKCDFAKKHIEPVYSFFSQSAKRKALTCPAVEKAQKIEDMFAALRQHEDNTAPLCSASVGSPCMHYGGLVGDHTTQSMAVELCENGEIRVWSTGRSTPCISIFKPFLLGSSCIAPVYKAGDENAVEYWLKGEKLHRGYIGHRLPKAFYAEKNAIEEEIIRLSRTVSGSQLHEVTIRALELEQAFDEKWSKINLGKERGSSIFKNNWKKKNALLGK